MTRRGEFLIGIMAGAGLMFLLDPTRGRRRRALIRDRIVHGAHEVEDFGEGLGSHARHARNRARGAVIETRRRHRTDDVEDAILVARVRAALGRIASRAQDIEVSAEHGRVTLRGVAPEAGMDSLVDGVQNVPGVHDVINRLRHA
jgi:osmotically-inducible protein OsmY